MVGDTLDTRLTPKGERLFEFLMIRLLFLNLTIGRIALNDKINRLIEPG